MKNQVLLLILIIIFIPFTIKSARSVQRKKDRLMPRIITSWHHRPNKKHVSYSWCIRKHPIFTINTKDSCQHLLPHTISVTMQGITKEINTIHLKQKLETLIYEIKRHKKKFTHFTVIHKSDFNHKHCCGFIVCKFKDYPLVVKLSLETPESFINPYYKGFVPLCFYYMSGGIGRHVTGLTRIPNLHRVRKKIAEKKTWCNKVKTPRKWFWMPNNVPMIDIVGINIGGVQEPMHNSLPAIYAVIADAVNVHTKCPNITLEEKSTTIMSLCNDLNCIIDPHENNYIFEWDNNAHDITITIIDTEHFPTMVGLPPTGNNIFSSHLQWYASLAYKCFNDMFACTKKKRTQLAA